MDRRHFLQNLAAAAAAIKTPAPVTAAAQVMAASRTDGPSPVSIDGHTLICELEQGGQRWKVYEDLRSREGTLTFLSSTGAARVLAKSAEATFAEEGPQHLGLSMDRYISTTHLTASPLATRVSRLGGTLWTRNQDQGIKGGA